MTTKFARDRILSEILHRIIKDEDIKEPEIEHEELPCTGQNYTAAIYLITIKEKNTILHLFAKLAKAGDIERKAMQITQMYERERFIYKELVALYKELEDKHNVANEHRYYFPKYYTSNDMDYQEALVLEDVSPKGFVTPSRFEPMDWGFASAAVNQLAKFHALSFIFECENPKMYESIIKSKKEYIYTTCRPPKEFLSKYIQERVKMCLDALSADNRVKFQAFVNKNDLDKGHQEQHELLNRSCFIHGDYKHTNLMTKIIDGKVNDIIPVDYQLCHYGSPINDLLYFIFTGSDQAFRQKYFDELIDFYYKCLDKALQLFSRHASEIYPRKEFDKDMKKRLIYGFYIGIFILPFMLADKKPDFNRKEHELTITSTKDYQERFRGIFDDFARWGYL